MSPAIIMKQCKRHCVACNLPTLDDRRTSERPPQQLPFKSHCGWPGLCRPHCLLWRHTTTGVCFVSLIKARVVHYIIILSTASCELWRNTDAILMPPLGRRMHPCIAPLLAVHLFVSNHPPCKLQGDNQAVQAWWQSLMSQYDVTIIDNWAKKIDFEQTIINFQEKTILTTLMKPRQNLTKWQKR